MGGNGMGAKRQVDRYAQQIQQYIKETASDLGNAEYAELMEQMRSWCEAQRDMAQIDEEPDTGIDEEF